MWESPLSTPISSSPDHHVAILLALSLRHEEVISWHIAVCKTLMYSNSSYYSKQEMSDNQDPNMM
jgi:hypothetical protein